MGTTFRYMHSWEIDTTAVELSRSVTESFGFFFPDFQQVLSDPRVHIVIDDGRRYLVRTNKKFDVITLDPPPPIETAVSSLLYSEEFYGVARDHLGPGGILQQWFPGGEDKIQYAVARSLLASFPYVVAFRSIEDWGYHFLASMSPIDDLTRRSSSSACRRVRGATPWNGAPINQSKRWRRAFLLDAPTSESCFRRSRRK
jgi:spermidine synthase